MSATLEKVLNAYGYPREVQQIALVKLAAYSGCFGDKFKDKGVSDITDDEATELLKNSFAHSLAEGVKRWSELTDKHMLRKNFKRERVGEGEDPFTNLERWLAQPEKPKDDKEGQAWVKAFNDLGLTTTVPWPKDSKKSLVVIHGALEEHAKERLNFIPVIPEILLYATNPRMCFNSEFASFAEVVADWFKYEGEKRVAAIEIIKEVLIRNMDFRKSDKNWLKNPTGLQDEILQALGEKTWPTGKGAYYRNSEPYERSAKKEGRPSPAGIPAAIDMVELILRKRAIAEPGQRADFEVIPIYSLPEENRVATTKDNVEDVFKWLLKLYGNEPPFDKLIWISNNDNLHYINYQDVQVKLAWEELEEIYGKMNVEIVTVGPGGDKINLLGGLDMLARQFYAQKPHILKNLEEPKLREEKALHRKAPEEVVSSASSASSSAAGKPIEGAGFFSPSKYASKESPFGPFIDYYCSPEDPAVQEGLGLAKK